MGRLPEAIQQFEAALQIVPGMAEAHCNLGIALEQSGKLSEAMTHYQEALQLKPGYAEAQTRLAALRARAGTTP